MHPDSTIEQMSSTDNMTLGQGNALHKRGSRRAPQAPQGSCHTFPSSLCTQCPTFHVALGTRGGTGQRAGSTDGSLESAPQSTCQHDSGIEEVRSTDNMTPGQRNTLHGEGQHTGTTRIQVLATLTVRQPKLMHCDSRLGNYKCMNGHRSPKGGAALGWLSQLAGCPGILCGMCTIPTDADGHPGKDCRRSGGSTLKTRKIPQDTRKHTQTNYHRYGHSDGGTPGPHHWYKQSQPKLTLGSWFFLGEGGQAIMSCQSLLIRRHL